MPIDLFGGKSTPTAAPIDLFGGENNDSESAPLPLTKEQKIQKFKDMAGINNKTPLDAIKNILVGLGTAGQNVAKTFTGGKSPSVDMESTFGVTPENRSNVIQGAAQYAPLIASGGLGLLGDAAIGTAYGATQDPDSPATGAAITGGTNAGFGLLNTLVSSSNPIIKAGARMAAGGLLGYGVGGKEGAVFGVGGGLVAPTMMKRMGIGKDVGQDVVSMINPEDMPQVHARINAANEEGLSITPGEASGRPDIRAREIRLGRVGQGASESYNIGKERMADEKSKIRELKNEISPAGLDSAHEIRKASQNAIKELETTRSKATEPYYTAAKSEEIPQHELDNLLETPRIKDTMHEVLNDKDLAPTLGGQQPTGKKMVAMVENRIDNLLDKARSKPYNKDRIDQLQYAKDNFASDYGDPKVQSVLKEIYKDDPVFQATAMGINARGMEFLDAVKKRINTASENMGSPMNMTGKDKYKAGLIQESANKITNVTDQYSQNYQTARSIHEQMSPTVDEAKNGSLGRLANLSDTQLKNASSIIFDPAQTNIRVLSKIKQQIMRRDPQAWNSIVRNEIDRLNKKGVIDGVSFYQKMFTNENQYNQFKVALDHNPEALKMFENLKTSWEDLSRPSKKATTAAEQEKIGMGGLRDSFLTYLEMIADQVGGKDQQAALRYLYSPKWQADLANIKSTANPVTRKRQTAIMFAKTLPPKYFIGNDNSNQ